ncbi:MAG: peptidoglycan DD-metalloendopeptidase family protein [Flavisolibacter sp.]
MNLIEILQRHAPDFERVVPFEPERDKLLRLDFTRSNRELNSELLEDAIAFTHYINNKLHDAGAVYGIGGYGEHRTIYRVSRVFDGNNGSEPRRLHLGIDIWGKPLTKVMAPLDGIVHSLGYNNDYGDYGATIILSHQVEGCTFYTLYGHLSLNSLKNLEEGNRVEAGDVFAEFGIPAENGHWPPHLHFQVIQNLHGMKGDYPGVCPYSEKDMNLQNCPNPDLILQMMQYAASDAVEA